MRFRRVGAHVLAGTGGGGGWVGGDAVRVPRFTAHGRNREAILAFVTAWMHRDMERLQALSTPDISCRWIGFGGAAVTAHGLDGLLQIGAEFERRHGVAERYTMVEAMGGESHAAILFEPADLGARADHMARVAIYGLVGERVATIAVYADGAD